MIKVKGFSKNGCPKCENAKDILLEYNIEWVNTSTDNDGYELATILGIKYLPAFIVGDENSLDMRIEQSVFRVRDILEKNKS